MDRELYINVVFGGVDDIWARRNRVAGTEWKDNSGKTPLMVACLRQDRFDKAKALIDCGANVNAFQPGNNGGTPLHHAIMRGLDQTAKLLLENGANPFIRNDNGDTALDLARKRRLFSITQTLECHMSIFSGWLRVKCSSALDDDFKPFPSNIRPGRVWALVLHNDTVDQTSSGKLQLAIYLAREAAKPWEVINLIGTQIDQSNINEPDPFVVIEASGTRYKLLSEYWGQKHKFELFYNAFRGVLDKVNKNSTTSSQNQGSITPSVHHRTASRSTRWVNSDLQQPPVPRRIMPVPTRINNSISSLGVHNAAPISTDITSARTTEGYTTNPEDIELGRTIRASIKTAVSKGVHIEPNLVPETSTHTESSRVQLKKKEVQQNDVLCLICWDSKVEAACVPCGHMAGCLACFEKIKAKSKKCPVCRANVEQVIKIYAI